MNAAMAKREAIGTIPFIFLESRRLVQLAARVERSLELAEIALFGRRMEREKFEEVVVALRRKIDGVAEVSRELMESVE